MTRYALATLVALVPAFVLAQPAVTPVFTQADLMAAVTTLASPEMAGRQAGTPGNEKARAWIVEQFRGAGLQPLRGSTYEMPFTFERRGNVQSEATQMHGVNLAGICRGTGAKDNGALVLTAHYDHLGVRDGATYHGADDNASGVSVLVALARHCQKSPWTHDAIFVAFDAEEMGLQGARAFVKAMPIPSDRTILLNVNFDMVARGDKNELYVAGTAQRPALRPVLEPVAARSKIRLLFGHDSGGGEDDWTTQSDHRAFHEAGIPFLYFGVEDHPDYHRPSDTADKINATFPARRTRSASPSQPSTRVGVTTGHQARRNRSNSSRSATSSANRFWFQAAPSGRAAHTASTSERRTSATAALGWCSRPCSRRRSRSRSGDRTRSTSPPYTIRNSRGASGGPSRTTCRSSRTMRADPFSAARAGGSSRSVWMSSTISPRARSSAVSSPRDGRTRFT
jgi:hypothetical protein